MMHLWRRLLDWLDPPPVMDGNCYRCRAPYEVQRVRVTFSERFGPIPERDVMMEICPRCGASGQSKGLAPETEPSYSWRGVGEPWTEARR
jgi:hypothetical protein